jgi:hypothetical protein
MAIGQCCVGQRLQSFGRLQLGGVWGHKVQMNACVPLHLPAHVPASAIEYKEERLAFPAPTAWANSTRAILNAAMESLISGVTCGPGTTGLSCRP